MNKYALCDRKGLDAASLRGLSCDEDGVFIAGDVPLVVRAAANTSTQTPYVVRSDRELGSLLSAAYGPQTISRRASPA